MYQKLQIPVSKGGRIINRKCAVMYMPCTLQKTSFYSTENIYVSSKETLTYKLQQRIVEQHLSTSNIY